MRRIRALRYFVLLLGAGLLAAAAAACGGSDDRGSDLSSVPGVPEAPGGGVEQDASSGETDAQSSQLDRKIIGTANLEITVADVAAGVSQVEGVAAGAGGFVSSSSVFLEPAAASDADHPRRTQTAVVTIRVPAEAYSSVMSQLRGMAEEILSETSETTEVTEEYTDLQSRLRNLEATEQQYLTLLERAQTVDDILSVQDRLNTVRGDIEQVKGRIQVLDELTELATITVQLALPSTAPEGGDDKNWAEKAWDESWEASQDAAVVLGTVAIAGVVALPWVIIPAIIFFVVWRRYGKTIVRWAKGEVGPPGVGPGPGGSGS